jgi:hypothetical protein
MHEDVLLADVVEIHQPGVFLIMALRPFVWRNKRDL